MYDPITLREVVVDPVRTGAVRADTTVTLDSQLYERSSLERWFWQQRQRGLRAVTSPLTGVALNSAALDPDRAERKKVSDWVLAKLGETSGEFSTAFSADERALLTEHFSASWVAGP